MLFRSDGSGKRSRVYAGKLQRGISPRSQRKKGRGQTPFERFALFLLTIPPQRMNVYIEINSNIITIRAAVNARHSNPTNAVRQPEIRLGSFDAAGVLRG